MGLEPKDVEQVLGNGEQDSMVGEDDFLLVEQNVTQRAGLRHTWGVVMEERLYAWRGRQESLLEISSDAVHFCIWVAALIVATA